MLTRQKKTSTFETLLFRYLHFVSHYYTCILKKPSLFPIFEYLILVQLFVIQLLFSVFYLVSINVSACQMVNETTHIQCHNGRSIQDQSLSINFQPAHVASCLQEHNISWDYENDCRKQNKSKCEINLFKGMLLHQCLVVPKREIVITYSCVEGIVCLKDQTWYHKI